MSYDLLALPVPPGAEIEEAGEALSVRLAGGHVYADASPAAAARRRALAEVVADADPALAPVAAAPQGRIALSDDGGLRVHVTERFMSFHVAYAGGGRAAADIFARLFRVAGAALRETGWRLYDPQGACGVEADDDGREATLELYLSVVDQLLPGRDDAAR